MELRTEFVTRFHRSLATPEWMTGLRRFTEECLRNVGGLQGIEGTGTVTAKDNEEKNMGPYDSDKYEFRIHALVNRTAGDSEVDNYESALVWEPKQNNFRLRWDRVTTAEHRRARELNDRLSEMASTPQGAKTVVEVLRATNCPICGSRIRIEYYPEGQVWWGRCPSNRNHFELERWYQDWKDSPVSWEDHIVDRTCPSCGSAKAVVGILYGLVRDTSKIDDAVWTLGGCMVGSDRWHCKACSKRF